MSENPIEISFNPDTLFIFSTSGSESSIEKHNRALRKLNKNLVYFTFPQHITAEEYANLLRSPISRGGAVTGKNGLKSSIISYLNVVEPIAQKTLAVNTVVNKKGELYGYNTDAIGLKTALQHALNASSNTIKTAAIYGNGGVSGVAYHVLNDLGIRVMMTGRNPIKVKAKKANLGIFAEDFNGPFDLVVDATPISSQADFLQSEGFANLLPECKMIFCHNMPEKDKKHNYLKAYCEKKGIEYIPGEAMYKAQLIRQYQLFIGDISSDTIIEHWKLDA